MRNGYSICFNEWALDKRIKNELNLLLIISSLCAERGFCWASNEYFSKLFEINEVSVSRKIKKLEQMGYITIEYEMRGCEVKKRIIRLTKMLIVDYQKSQSSINKNVKENNISINNTSINKKEIYKEKKMKWLKVENIPVWLNQKINKKGSPEEEKEIIELLKNF